MRKAIKPQPMTEPTVMTPSQQRYSSANIKEMEEYGKFKSLLSLQK
jgi:hypothetical protein